MVTTPDGDRFKASLQVGGHDVPLVALRDEEDATYVASTILDDLDWQVHGGKVVAHSADSPLGLGTISQKAEAEGGQGEACWWRQARR